MTKRKPHPWWKQPPKKGDSVKQTTVKSTGKVWSSEDRGKLKGSKGTK